MILNRQGFVGDPIILVRVGMWQVRFRAAAVAGTAVWHGWSSSALNAAFLSFVDPAMTLHEPSMAARVLAVTAHRSRREFLAADGVTYNVLPGTEDDIWPGASRGPSRRRVPDQKPELSAPGVFVASALSTLGTLPALSVQTPDRQHFLTTGTSMSAPHVAGALALMLAVNPTLTPEQAEAIIVTAACTDNDTCQDDPVTRGIAGLPNTIWGTGKLDALAAAQGAFQQTFGGFPSLSETDGRVLTVSAQGLGTIDRPWVVLRLAAASTTSRLHVDVFDGDVGGQYDVVVDLSHSCYRIIADGDGTVPDPSAPYLVQAGDVLVTELQSDDPAFADNAFGLLYDGPHDAAARAPSGNYFYRLAVVQGPDCVTPDNTRTTINGFKIRAGAQVSIRYGQWGFIAGDNAGPFVSPNPFIAPALDTSFDGTFSFFARITPAMTGADFTDADADHLLDADSPGVATGANDRIRYDVAAPGGRLLFSTTTLPADPTPSGNYDTLAMPAVMDIETNRVPFTGLDGYLSWRWVDMFTENNIFVTVPGASPTPVEIFSAPVQALRFSAVRSSCALHDFEGSFRDFMPITLGGAGDDADDADEDREADGRLVVRTDEQARAILAAGCPGVLSGDCDDDDGQDGGDHDGDDRDEGDGAGERDDDEHEGHDSGDRNDGGRDEDLECDADHHDRDDGDDRRARAHSEWNRLLAELFAARLNAELVAPLGEDFLAEFIYASELTVADAIAAAEALVTAVEDPDELTPAQRLEVVRLSILLQVANSGDASPVGPAYGVLSLAPDPAPEPVRGPGPL